MHLQYSSFIRPNREHDNDHWKNKMPVEVEENNPLNMHHENVEYGLQQSKEAIKLNINRKNILWAHE